MKNGADPFGIMSSAPVGICILHAETLTCEMVNPRFLEMTGQSAGAMTGKFFWDAFPERMIHDENRLKQVATSGRAYYGKESELPHNRLHKQLSLPATLVYIPVKNDDGKVVKIVVWLPGHTLAASGMKDLRLDDTEEELQTLNEELSAANEELAATNEEFVAINEELAATNEELTEAQANLRRSERLFRSIAVNIPKSLVIVIDPSHRYILVEGDLMDKMGYSRGDYAGKHPTEIGQTERYEESKHLYDRMMAGKQFSLERRGANNEYYIVHFVPLKNEQNEVEAGLVMVIDITDIRQAEEKSARLAAIVESSDDAIVSKTLESVITSWNDSAQRMFGYTADEMIGETIYKIIPADRLDEEPRILARLRKGERVEHFETKRITKDGTLLDVSLSISPVKDAMGHIIGASKIARDITAKKREEQRKNDFIGMVSHELKTPLTSISAIIQLASDKLKSSNDQFLAGAIEKARLQIKRMTAMINGFLDVSRLEAGKMRIEKQTFELRLLLHEILDEMKLIITSHQFKLQEFADVAVNADRDKIASVISNMVSNAVKYSSKGTAITIRCLADKEMAVVSVTDEGIGIAPQDLGRVFDRYFRVEANQTRHISGFGIGLYLSAEIITQHGGKIWAESKPGKGSTFYFSLPIA